MWYRRWLLCMSLFVWLSFIFGCMTTGPAHRSLQNVDLPKLIPAYTFFQSNFGYWRYQISPNGVYLAVNALKNDIPSLFIWRIGSEDVYYIRTLHNRIISEYAWLPDSRQILFAQPITKDTQHIFIADITAPDHPPIDLTPAETGELEMAHIGQAEPNIVWVYRNQQDQNLFDLRRLDLSTKELTPVESHTTWVIRWIMDGNDQLRGRITREMDLSHRLELYDSDHKRWKLLIDWDFDETVDFLGFSADNRSMWLLSNRHRDKVSLVSLDLKNGCEKIVYQDLSADITMVTMSKKQQKPLIAYCHPDYPKIHYLDDNIKRILTPFQPAPPIGFHVVSSDENEQIIGFTIYTDKTKDTYLYDRINDRKYFLGDSEISLQASELADMRPISILSRDGLILNGYLTLPKGVEPKNLPTVLLAHGGPWARDYWEYDNLVQFLANRGYAVLQINFRGSMGYGKTFMRKAMGEFAGKMHDDLVDGVQWAVDQGYSDPSNIAVVGWSYGGYAALVGLTFTPHLFKCGIAIAGISDLTTLLDTQYTNFSPSGLYYWHKYAGNPEDDLGRERMKAKSPIIHVDKIVRPLLIVHGGEDKIVSSIESDQMVDAMKKAGKEVDYVFFPDEGHRFYKWKNWLVLYRKIEVFLGTHLGGRYSY